MDKETIDKLAQLARIDIREEEAQNLAGELGTILKYVDEIRSVPEVKGGMGEEKKKEDFPNRNVLREDDPPAGGAHEGGLYTEELLDSAPEREGEYIKVKKIL